ncbi:MAG: DsbE family thiol:disulfide interchange protein [Pseudomonadales bacterium]
MQRLKLFLPLLVFALLAALLFGRLGENPEYLPSALIDKSIPEFELPELHDATRTLTQKDLLGEPGLLNVWASWCFACRIEHPFLTRIATDFGVPLYGLNYKNEVDEAQKWLREFGNPYDFNIVDRSGRLGIDLGVAGAPETFVFDQQGRIRHRHIGIVDDKVWAGTLQPLLQQLRDEK